jgi:hypothetical protein
MEDRMSRQGNPNWGKPTIFAPPLPTEFERQVEKLGLRPDQYQDSPQLRDWCLKNATTHYVPEYLLKTWEVSTHENWGHPAEYVVSTRVH